MQKDFKGTGKGGYSVELIHNNFYNVMMEFIAIRELWEGQVGEWGGG